MRALSFDRGPLLPTLLLLPSGVLLGGLLALPLAVGGVLGFQDTTIGNPGAFVGLDNYRYLLTDPVFRITALNTALYTVVTVAFKLALGLALALILNQRFAGYRFWRSILLLPYVVPTVLSAFAWWWILDPQFSFVSWALVKLGLLDQRINFLGNAWLARGSLMVANVWRGIPFFTVGYLAGLQAIPKDLHEAAALDGASEWQIFWRITWILLLPLSTILTIFSAIFTFTDFQLIWTITRGGPANATHLFVTLAYQRAIPGGAMGEGAAIAGFTLPFLAVLAWAALDALRRQPCSAPSRSGSRSPRSRSSCFFPSTGWFSPPLNRTKSWSASARIRSGSRGPRSPISNTCSSPPATRAGSGTRWPSPRPPPLSASRSASSPRSRWRGCASAAPRA